MRFSHPTLARSASSLPLPSGDGQLSVKQVAELIIGVAAIPDHFVVIEHHPAQTYRG